MPDINHEVKRVYRVKLDVENHQPVFIYLEGHTLESFIDNTITLDGKTIKVENASVVYVTLTAYRSIGEV